MHLSAHSSKYSYHKLHKEYMKFTSEKTLFTIIHTHTHIKKNKIMSLAATWMDLKIIKLSEVSQTKTNTI